MQYLTSDAKFRKDSCHCCVEWQKHDMMMLVDLEHVLMVCF